MIITVAKVSPQAQHGLRTLVREEHHQIAVDAELAAPDQPKSIISPGLSLVTTPAEPVNKVDLQKVHKVVESAIWPLAKEKIPFSNPTIDGVEVVFAGKKLWDRIATGDQSDRVQVALAATDFGLELYDLVSKFVPPMQAFEPYRATAGLLVNGVDTVYAVYFSKDDG